MEIDGGHKKADEEAKHFSYIEVIDGICEHEMPPYLPRPAL
jgi:hypothetical protein